MAKKICSLGQTLLAVIAFSIFALTAGNRCGYARKPFATETVWRDKGEDVTLNCPGYKNNSFENQSVEYSWFRQDYSCEGMATSSIIAYYTPPGREAGSESEEPAKRMTVDKYSGAVTVRNLTVEDGHTLTCLFSGSQDYIATVHLKIKEFEPPVFIDLPDSIFENEVRYAKCIVPRMHPATGFIEVMQDGKLITTWDLVEGPVAIPISGKAEPGGTNLTCTAVQNVSGVVNRLSTSVQVNILYSYHTQVISSVPEQPLESTNVTMTCEVTREGNPKEITGYTWLKDGREMTNGQVLHLGNVTDVDTGSYQCLITNSRAIQTPMYAAQAFVLDVVPLISSTTTKTAANVVTMVSTTVSTDVSTTISTTASTAAIAGYSVLGCAGLAAFIGIIVWAVWARHNKSRKSQSVPIYEGHHYQGLRMLRRSEKNESTPDDRGETFSEIYEDSDLLCMDIEGQRPCPPAPPPLPERDLTGLKLLEDCPETDQHYKNRTAIMAAIPKKPSFSITKTDSLENILEHCKEYSTSPKKPGASEAPTTPGEYVEMKNVTVGGEKNNLETPNSEVAQSCASSSPSDGSVVPQVESTKSDYIDMRGIDKSGKATAENTNEDFPPGKSVCAVGGASCSVLPRSPLPQHLC